MKRTMFALLILIAGSPLLAQEEPTTATVLASLLEKNAGVAAFSADIEVRENHGRADDVVATSSLLVSRKEGWRLEGGPAGSERIVVNNYAVSYDYYPWDKTAIKMSANSPEVRALFRKPADEINPVAMLDTATLVLNGEETLDGEAVYHFSGTTITQLLKYVEPSERRIEAWVSKDDGLPRKTVEYTPQSTATTFYRNVTVNPDVPKTAFEFTPPKDVKVIDVDNAPNPGR